MHNCNCLSHCTATEEVSTGDSGILRCSVCVKETTDSAGSASARQTARQLALLTSSIRASDAVVARATCILPTRDRVITPQLQACRRQSSSGEIRDRDSSLDTTRTSGTGAGTLHAHPLLLLSPSLACDRSTLSLNPRSLSPKWSACNGA